MTIGIYDSGNAVYYTPDKTANKKITPRVIQHTFGDGYEQRAVDGINNINETYTLAFSNRGKAEIDDLIAFLNSKKGVTKFDLILPDSNQVGGEKTVKVVTTDYQMNFTHDDFYSASVTLKRVYEA
jgi:phage-related protein